jgi:hypothetical protein
VLSSSLLSSPQRTGPLLSRCLKLTSCLGRSYSPLSAECVKGWSEEDLRREFGCETTDFAEKGSLTISQHFLNTEAFSKTVSSRRRVVRVKGLRGMKRGSRL